MELLAAALAAQQAGIIGLRMSDDEDLEIAIADAEARLRELESERTAAARELSP